MRILALFLLASSAWATTYTVGTGKQYATITSCIAAQSASGGDTCVVYAGTYNETPTLKAGAVGAYNIVQVNGADLVYVYGFTAASHTKIIGFQIQHTAIPKAAACVAAGSNTDIYITNNVMYACGGSAMITGTGSYVYIRGNIMSYPGGTIAQAASANCPSSPLLVNMVNWFGGGHHVLIENNDLSHYDLAINLNASYTFVRNNVFHDIVEREASGNCHTDAWYSEPGAGGAATTYSVFEGNTVKNGTGVNAKVILAQADAGTPCAGGGCFNLIERYNAVSNMGGGVNSPAANTWPYIKFYNNTIVDANTGINGITNNLDNQTYASQLNSIYGAYTWPGSYNTIYSCGSNCNRGYNLFHCFGTCAGLDWPNDTGNKNQNPSFVSYTAVGNAANDYHLQAGSPAVNAGTYLTTVAAGDSGSGTSLVVNDSRYFQDGFGLEGVNADCVSVGTVANHVCITAINYSTNTLTLAGSVSRSSGQGVYLYSKSDGVQVLTGSAPDMGAYPYGGGGCSILPSSIGPYTGTQTSGFTTFSASGCNASSYTVTAGSLTGSGLALNSSTGALSGTAVAGSYTFTVGYDTASTGSMTLTINAVPSITSSGALPGGAQNQAYSQGLTTTGGTGTLACLVASGSLPTGLSFTNCTIGGTPTVAGTYNFTARVTDANSVQGAASAGLSIVISAPDTTAPVIVHTSFCEGISVPGSCTLPAAAASGNRLVVVYNSYNSAGTTPVMNSVTAGTDSLSQLTNSRSIDSVSNSWNDVWSGVLTGSRSSVTVTPSTSQTGNVLVYELQYAANVIACSALNSQPATTTAVGASITVPAKAAILGYDHPNVVAVSGVAAPFTEELNPPVTDNYVGYAHYTNAAAGTYAPQWTQASGTFAAATCGFSASAVVPGVTTTAASNITATTATAGGNVTTDGGDSVTGRGTCYSTSVNPTSPCTNDGAGLGVFTSSLSALSPGTAYHIRAFATNSVGTAYGSDLSFSTSGVPAVILDNASHDFGSQMVGVPSADFVFTLQNIGSGPLTITSTTPSGDFSDTSNCPISPASLAIGNSCTITATFTPSVTGVRSGSISIVDNAADSPQVISLSGTGSPNISASIGTGVSAGTVNIR